MLERREKPVSPQLLQKKANTFVIKFERAGDQLHFEDVQLPIQRGDTAASDFASVPAKVELVAAFTDAASKTLSAGAQVRELRGLGRRLVPRGRCDLWLGRRGGRRHVLRLASSRLAPAEHLASLMPASRLTSERVELLHSRQAPLIVESVASSSSTASRVPIQPKSRALTTDRR
jgi:hypothetical protein